MHLIVGLGNPGKNYLFTRHNIGFIAVDVFKESFDPVPSEKSEQKALTYKISFEGNDILLVKPQTYMNLSGESVRGLMAYYKIPIENILIIHDDIDSRFGSIKFQKARGAGGHNGIRSIHELLGTDQYARLKLGVGRPLNPNQSVEDYVLQNFSTEEKDHLEDYMIRVCDAIESFVKDGFEKASNLHNKKLNYHDQKEEEG